MDKIKISIITITYNSERTIEDTIISIVSQNYPNLEYIIVDGGSTDKTKEIINKYREKISIFISEKDNGISDAFNKGIKLSTGEVIGIINSDDALMPNSLNTINEEYDEKIDVYYGNCITWDEETNEKARLKPADDLECMSYSFSIVHPSTFVSRKAYEKFGVFSLDYRCSMDYELLLRMYKAKARFKRINADLAVYRMGGTNQRLRDITLTEIRQISVKYGLNKEIAAYHYWRKKTNDLIKKVLNKFGLISIIGKLKIQKRVEKL